MSKNETKTVTFMSPNHSLSIGLKSAMYREVNGVRELSQGIRANFADQVFTTEDPEIIEMMRANKHNTENGGTLFTEINVQASDEIKDKLAQLNDDNKSLEQKEADVQAEKDAKEEGSSKVARKSTPKKTAKKSKAEFND